MAESIVSMYAGMGKVKEGINAMETDEAAKEVEIGEPDGGIAAAEGCGDVAENGQDGE